MKLRADAAIFMCILCALRWIPSTAFAEIHYVNVNSTNPLAPFASWSTAAQTIQEAADISADGDLVLVTNGYYHTGGVANYPAFSGLTNRLAITNAITVRSVNGPNVTFILGGGPLGDAAIRGVFMAPGAALSGFTIGNGYTRTAGDYYNERSGGGVWCSDQSCELTNCIIVDSVAAKFGGGVYQGTLHNCTVMRNNSSGEGGGVWEGSLYSTDILGNFSFLGGGVYYSSLYNCTIADNVAFRGGGAEGGELQHCTIVTNLAIERAGGVFGGALVNCIVYYNDCTNNANWEDGTFSFTCADPLPGGEGNITNEPAFVSISAGDFRLMSNSPCIDTGANGALVDKDGIPRPLDGNLDGTNTADMGAFEFVHGASDSDLDGMLDPWEIQYNFDPLSPADAGLDYDGDRQLNLQEFIAGTIPTNASSYFHLTRIRQSATNELVTWGSATGRVYKLERMMVMTGDTWSVVGADLAARPPENTYTDALPSTTSKCFYRVWVQRTNVYYPP
jgi:hypothetical protein